jgi:hypothetical protein
MNRFFTYSLLYCIGANDMLNQHTSTTIVTIGSAL